MVQRGLLDEEMLQKNVLLFKNMPMYMSGYRVTYEGDTIVGNLRKFFVKYEKMSEQGEVVEEFKVVPTATYDNKVTEVKAFNPDTKRYLTKDIFTHIATLPMKEANFQYAREQEDSMAYEIYLLSDERTTTVHDTLESQAAGKSLIKTEVKILGVNRQPTHPDYKPQEGDFAVGLKLAFEKEDTTYIAEPVLVLREQLLYTYPVQLNDLSFKVRLTDDVLDKLFPAEEQLGYKSFTLRQGEKITMNGLELLFRGFNKDPKHPGYKKEEGDIAISAMFEVTDSNNVEPRRAEPLYLIRGTLPFNLKDEIEPLGLHFRFTGIDPEQETIEVMIAQKKIELKDIPVQIAKKSLRTDYIVLEAIVFPGINLFWLGSSLMMVGLAVSMFRRIRERRSISSE
jgi:cytochrome c-type biogenesis protein CcmF